MGLGVAPLLRRLVAAFPPWWPGFDPKSGVGFVLNKVALGQVLPKYIGFLCQLKFHQLFQTHHHHHPWPVQWAK
jgi:hypothetical protein